MKTKNENKSHHFVPKFYLSNFSDSSNKFYAFDFNMNEILTRPVSVRSQCAKDFFYGEDNVLERRLKDMEGNWASTLRKVNSMSNLDENDLFHLKEFIVIQKQRTSIEERHTRENGEAFLKTCALLLSHQRRLGIVDNDVVNACKKEIGKECISAKNVDIASEMLKYIKDLDVLVVHYNTSNSLITSDSPVVALNSFVNFHSYGLDNLGIALMAPVSPKHLLIVYDPKLYVCNKGKLYIESDAYEEVSRINKYELINAERFAYSTEIESLMVDEDLLDKRKVEEKRNEPSVIGPEGHQLIVSASRGLNYYYELPYLKLPRAFRRIPQLCREPIPRHYNNGWADRLSNNYAMRCFIAEKSKRNLPMSKKELKQGFDKMNRAAQIYWQS